ncbi:hypothetical protein GOC15_07295 [Sinorhizobium meliloti]|nr:hypothetical protein [Sinorhizobium meliloti]
MCTALLRTIAALPFLVADWAHGAAPEKRSDNVVIFRNIGNELMFFPLNPQIIKNSNDRYVINIFVKTGSFGLYNLTISPTLSWKLTPDEENDLAKTKSDGIKAFSTWPGVAASVFPFHVEPDGDISSTNAEFGTITVGATSVMEVTYANLELNDALDLLNGKREWGVLFNYRMEVPGGVGSDVDPSWLKQLPTDLQSFGLIPVDGAVDFIFSSLRQRYTEEFRVSSSELRSTIERYVKSAPFFPYAAADGVRLTHDLSGQQEIDIPSEQTGSNTIQEFFQGRLLFGNLCQSSSSTVFVTTENGSAVGCEAIGK